MVDWSTLTDNTEHRPWPLPARPWAMTMSWLDLLFAHWRCEAEALAALLPDGLELDTFDGRAYLGVVPFYMRSVGPRWLSGLPAELPGPRAFLELNVRTYVVHDGKPGVWFLSLDAADGLAVRGARWGFHLPYFHADITTARQDDWVRYSSRRTDRRLGAGIFRGRYRPVGDRLQVEPGSLEYWLTERYCLYAADQRGRVRRGDIHHSPWPLHEAEVEIEMNTVADAHGFPLEGPPELAHFAHEIDVVGWWLD